MGLKGRHYSPRGMKPPGAPAARRPANTPWEHRQWSNMPFCEPVSRGLRGRVLALALGLGFMASAQAGAADTSSPWFEAGRPSPLAQQALDLLAAAPSQGLNPTDYATDALRQRFTQAGPAADDATRQRLGHDLQQALAQYLSDLRLGRVDPRQLGYRFAPPAHASFDPAALLQQALAAGKLADLPERAAPALPQYAELRQAMQGLQTLAGHPAWAHALPALPRPKPKRPGKLQPGQPWDGLPRLGERLRLLGDLPAKAALPASYTGPWVEAVRGFQARHGLTADGVIGQGTLAALEVKPEARAKQIALNLERLRWTPLTLAPRMVVINIPEFTLRAYEVQNGRIAVRHTMRVIVGKSLDTRTPVFDEWMRFIEFSPYWNIPPSIARAETVPRLRRDPGYLAREDMEFVHGSSAISTEVTPQVLADVLAGRARIRQRPGPKNALGEIKFTFPNSEHIYLHHTPSVGLFERTQRDFSHGCVRVQDPVALALFVLQDMPQWTEARVREAMAAGQLQTVKLATPVPVLIAYGTALIKQGQLHFYPDIYGHDRSLAQAMAQPRSLSPKAAP